MLALFWEDLYKGYSGFLPNLAYDQDVIKIVSEDKGYQVTKSLVKFPGVSIGSEFCPEPDV